MGGWTGAGADGGFLHADRRRPVYLRPDRGRQFVERRLCDGRPADDGTRDRRRFRKTVSIPRRSPQIFRGGFDKLREAGVALLGGHTVQDKEIKFGYAVTGAVDPERILTNTGAQAGDVLILTKPLGTGVVGTAIKFGRARGRPDRSRPSTQMRTLNKRRGRSGRARSTASTRAPTSPGSACRPRNRKWPPASGVTIEIESEAAARSFEGVLEIASAQPVGRDGQRTGSTSAPGVDACGGSSRRPRRTSSSTRRPRAAC